MVIHVSVQLTMFPDITQDQQCFDISRGAYGDILVSQFTGMLILLAIIPLSNNPHEQNHIVAKVTAK